MNNKKLGAKFEQEFCGILRAHGWWAHFLSPNNSGAQPFDIIAVKEDRVLAVDCKTCGTNSFPLFRVEDNQRYAMRDLVWRTNAKCGFIILYGEKIYFISYHDIRSAEMSGCRSIKLTEEYEVDESFY